jgi:predicted transcriptional regulator
MIEKVQQLIVKYNLQKRCRKRFRVHQRAFLMLKLLSYGLSVSKIAEMFKMNHATVLHNVKNANYFEQVKDALYLSDIADIQEELVKNPVSKNVNNLVLEILECTTVRRLEKIQRRILQNEYNIEA